MTPKEKANELALEFCSHSDIFRPNIASIRNAIKCCEQIIKLDENKAQYWEEVIVELIAI